MITPAGAVEMAVRVAAEGLAAGEMPIGALVLAGETILGRAYPQERARARRIVHADLLAIIEADHRLGFERPKGPLTLVVTLEPCLMCLGAAITLGVRRVWFGLESPNDGAVELLDSWAPPIEQPFFRRPDEIVGGLHREIIQAQFRQYADQSTGPTGMREWARGLANR